MNRSVATAVRVPLASRHLSRQAVIAALAVLGAFRLAVLVIALRQGQAADIPRFFEIGHASGRPYADYAVEYPPILLALVKLMAFATPNEHTMAATVVLISLLAELFVAVALWRVFSPEAALCYLTLDTLLLGLFVVRLDLLSVAFVVAALVSTLRSRPTLAAVCIVVAVGLKLWPAPLALLLLVLMPASARRRYALAALGSLAALLAVWLALGGVSGVEQVLTFRGATGWQIESVLGSIVRLVTGEPALPQTGAHRIGHIPPGFAFALQLAAVAVSVWVATRLRGVRDLGAAWVAVVGCFLVASTLFSPQFTAWLMPAGAIAWVSGDGVVAVSVAAVTIGTLLENAVYLDVVLGRPGAMMLVVARNALLVMAVAISVVTLHRRGRTAVSKPGVAAA